MFIKELLSRKGQEVITIPPKYLLNEAVELLTDTFIGAIAVSEDGRHVQGILSERDVVEGLRQYGPEVLQMQVEELMTEDVITCNNAAHIAEIVALLDKHHIRHMPVVDDQGNLEGMISMRDVVELRLKDLEQEVTILNRQLTKKV